MAAHYEAIKSKSPIRFGLLLLTFFVGINALGGAICHICVI